MREFPKVRVELVGGDLALPATRAAIFNKLDESYQDCRLSSVVHNAGQYVGVTSANCANLGSVSHLQFGDGSLLCEDGSVDFGPMHYYQQLCV